MKVSEIIEHLRGSGYEKHADIIESQAERCVGFNMIPTDESDILLSDVPSQADYPYPPSLLHMALRSKEGPSISFCKSTWRMSQASRPARIYLRGASYRCFTMR